jgi:hypothetical protein
MAAAALHCLQLLLAVLSITGWRRGDMYFPGQEAHLSQPKPGGAMSAWGGTHPDRENGRMCVPYSRKASCPRVAPLRAIQWHHCSAPEGTCKTGACCVFDSGGLRPETTFAAFFSVGGFWGISGQDFRSASALTVVQSVFVQCSNLMHPFTLSGCVGDP